MDEIVQWAREFPGELTACWQELPNKLFFFVLLAAWLLLFQFYGNATFGYIDTASLPYWMYFTYTNPMAHGEDGHGILVPPVVLILLWWKRKELLATASRVWWPGFVMLFFAALLHIVGYMVQQPRISIVGFFGGIYALVGLAWGPAWLRKTFFPFFLFMFCVPITSIGEPITVPLRLMVTKIVAAISNGLGIGVIREGNQLYNMARTYSYEVAAACSGLQSLIAIFAISTIYAFVFLQKGWKRTVMIAAALPLAILGNVFRMMSIIIAAEMYGQKGGNYVHENLGLLPYIPAIVGVMLLGNWLSEPPQGASALPQEARGDARPTYSAEIPTGSK